MRNVRYKIKNSISCYSWPVTKVSSWSD